MRLAVVVGKRTEWAISFAEKNFQGKENQLGRNDNESTTINSSTFRYRGLGLTIVTRRHFASVEQYTVSV